MTGNIGAIWGIVGVSLLLGRGIYSLAPHACRLYAAQLTWLHWLALLASVIFMTYSEGYKGFQLGFSPRVAARARYLKNSPTLMRTLLAPLFCMGFFHATRKRKIMSWLLTTSIITLIVLVSRLPPPWRGIVDVGVIIGLMWGLFALWWFSFQAFFGNGFNADPETPDR